MYLCLMSNAPIFCHSEPVLLSGSFTDFSLCVINSMWNYNAHALGICPDIQTDMEKTGD